MTALRRADLLELKAELLVKTAKDKKTPLKAKSVNNILMVAKTIMGYAAELEVIADNPWRRVKPCKVVQRDFAYWRKFSTSTTIIFFSAIHILIIPFIEH